MKRLSCLLLVAATLFTTRAGAQTTAIEMNDKMATITDSLSALGQAWGSAYMAIGNTKDYSSLRPLREGMSRFIDRQITIVTNTKDVNNSKPLRTAMLGFLTFERSMVEEFRKFEAFNTATSPETINAAIENLSATATQEGDHLAALVKAQDTYATENGYKITAKPEETR